MMLTRRSVTVGSAAVATSALVLGARGARRSPPPHAQDVRRGRAGGLRLGADLVSAPSTARSALTPPPIGVPILGFVSVAMHRAAERSAHVGTSSESAAVARAAHDVLVHYFPTFRPPAFRRRPGHDLCRHRSEPRAHQGQPHRRRCCARPPGEPRRRRLDGPQHPLHQDGGPRRVVAQHGGQTDMLGAWLGSLRTSVRRTGTAARAIPPRVAGVGRGLRGDPPGRQHHLGDRRQPDAVPDGTALLLGSVVPAVMGPQTP